MKVMIDTNIIISGALNPSGFTAKALYKALSAPYELFSKQLSMFRALSVRLRFSTSLNLFGRCPAVNLSHHIPGLLSLFFRYGSRSTVTDECFWHRIAFGNRIL